VPPSVRRKRSRAEPRDAARTDWSLAGEDAPSASAFAPQACPGCVAWGSRGECARANGYPPDKLHYHRGDIRDSMTLGLPIAGTRSAPARG
jgi:hypothetical protein